jgi:hypothetical protein
MEGVFLRGKLEPLDSDTARNFISVCRYLEDLLGETILKAKYNIDETTWAEFANNGPLLQAVEAEKIRRIHNGSAARERSQQLFAQAPNVLGGILHDDCPRRDSAAAFGAFGHVRWAKRVPGLP